MIGATHRVQIPDIITGLTTGTGGFYTGVVNLPDRTAGQDVIRGYQRWRLRGVRVEYVPTLSGIAGGVVGLGMFADIEDANYWAGLSDSAKTPYLGMLEGNVLGAASEKLVKSWRFNDATSEWNYSRWSKSPTIAEARQEDGPQMGVVINGEANSGYGFLRVTWDVEVAGRVYSGINQ